MVWLGVAMCGYVLSGCGRCGLVSKVYACGLASCMYGVASCGYMWSCLIRVHVVLLGDMAKCGCLWSG